MGHPDLPGSLVTSDIDITRIGALKAANLGVCKRIEAYARSSIYEIIISDFE